MKRLVRFEINGREVEDAVSDNTLLVDYLRQSRHLSGTKQGCDGGECGACTVLIDGVPRLACITLTASLDGAHIETIEGQVRNGRLSALQRAFHQQLGTQCGFCTPGMIMAAEGLLRQTPDPDDAQIRAALGGNLCRCTGYGKIVAAVKAAAKGDTTVSGADLARTAGAGS